jgi:hypothetical protein
MSSDCKLQSYPECATWGDTHIALEWSWRDPEAGTLVEWASGTIRIRDASGTLHVDGDDCIVTGADSDTLSYTPAFGTSANQIDPINRLTEYHVQFIGTVEGGGSIHSPVFVWRVQPAL